MNRGPDQCSNSARNFSEAVTYATAAHADQVRKGTSIPYIAHPIAVACLVIEHGGTEVQAIAALLHDVLEDCGPHHGSVIAERFGTNVLAIVESLTDGVPNDRGAKPPWRARKEQYVAHLAEADRDIVLVSACDKLHNAIAISDDHSAIGEAVFDRFSQPKASTVWYCRELERVIAERLGADHVLVGVRDS